MDAEPLLAFTVRGTHAAKVYNAARDEMAERPPLEGPLRIDVLFLRPRPPGGGGEKPVTGLSVAALAEQLTTGLLGVVLRRGSQVVTLNAAKRWGPEARAVVEVFAA